MLGKQIATVLAAVALTGCSAVVEQISRDSRDAPWDPREGQLFDQIPAWDGAATRICCGHLRECQPHQSPRC